MTFRLTPELDWTVQWMFPGLQTQIVASYDEKSLEISRLASKFDVLVMDPKSIIPTIDFVRYQPQPGVERHAVSLLHPRPVKRLSVLTTISSLRH